MEKARKYPDRTVATKTAEHLERILERHVQSLWAYVRTHAHSLDSDRIQKHLRAGLDAAVADVRDLYQNACLQLEELQQKTKAARRKPKQKTKLQQPPQQKVQP